jgi:hypothetical protein
MSHNNSGIGIAVLSGLISIVISLVVNILYNRWTGMRLRRSLKFEPESLFGVHERASIINGYIRSLSNVIAYISVDFTNDDVISVKDNECFITKNNFMKLTEDRICWAKAGNPDEIEILPGERQRLDIFSINRNASPPYIEIPSEKGWSDQGKARVRLRIKKYSDVKIKLVCREIKAKTFEIEIDPDLNIPIKCK